MPIVYANIGSNLGDRQRLIQEAIDNIGKEFGYYCLSNFVESNPWGFDSTNCFMNIGISFKTDLKPEQVLDVLQRIEKTISLEPHRDKNGEYKDREIDIDIMAIDDIRYKSERLTLPHPHLFKREFFIRPLMELLPNF